MKVRTMPRSGRDSERRVSKTVREPTIHRREKPVCSSAARRRRANQDSQSWTDSFQCKSHHQRRGMPAAGDQAAVNAIFRRLFVGVVRQRHIALAEFEYFFFVDRNGTEFVHGAGNVVFKITVRQAMI